MTLQDRDAEPTSGPEVFVSYNQSSTLEEALALYDWLDSLGVSVWLDRKELEPGDNWPSEIVHAIEGCKVFLWVAKQASLESKEVSNEIAIAKQKDKLILPVYLEPVELTGNYLYMLPNVQFVNLFGDDEARGRKAIIRALDKRGVAISAAAFKQDSAKGSGARRDPDTLVIGKPPSDPELKSAVEAHPAPRAPESPPKPGRGVLARRAALVLVPLALLVLGWQLKGPLDAEETKKVSGITLELRGWLAESPHVRLELWQKTDSGEFDYMRYQKELRPADLGDKRFTRENGVTSLPVALEGLDDEAEFEVRIYDFNPDEKEVTKKRNPETGEYEPFRLNRRAIVTVDVTQPSESYPVFPNVP